MSSAMVHLKPEQAAVVSSLQRLSAGMAIEAQQLAGIYSQEGVARELALVVTQLNRMAEVYMRDAQRSIVIASEMPNGPRLLPGLD